MDQIEVFFKSSTVIIIGITTLFGFLGGFIVFITKLYKKIADLHKALTPNGGGSIFDMVVEMRHSLIINEKRSSMLWNHVGDIGYYECNAALGNNPYACTAVNNYLLNLFGIDEHDFLGSGWTRAIKTQADRERVNKEWISACKDLIPYDTTYEIRNQRTKKEYLVRTTAHSIKNRRGEVIKMCGTLSVVKEL